MITNDIDSTAGSVAALLSNSEFHSLLSKWVADRRAPLVLADWLREAGYPHHAGAVDWAAWEIDRPLWEFYRQGNVSGVFPAWNYSYYKGGPDRRYFWSHIGNTRSRGCDADELPPSLHCVYTANQEQRYFDTPEEAIVALLDAWAEAELAGRPLPVPTIGVLTKTK